MACVAILAICIVGIRLSLNSSARSASNDTPHGTAGPSTTTLPLRTSGSQLTALSQSIESLLGSRIGTVEIAVENLNTNVTLTYGPETPQDEASVVKVNILAALLAADSNSNSPLSVPEQTLAREMIEASDNTAATSLWNTAGGTTGLANFDKRIGLTATTPSSCVQCADFPWPGWGLTTTSPLDEIKLLRAVFVDHEYLSTQGRAYELQLMESIVPSERWGVSSGVTSTATVALKNGWLPLNVAGTDWQINSVGWIRGDGRNYLIALFSTGNPSEEYGIQTLDSLSTLIWGNLGS